MSNKLEKVQSYIDRILIDPSTGKKNPYMGEDYAHLIGVSSFCSFLAFKRKLDPELAAIIGLFHDIYRFKTGVDNYHGINGAEMCRVILRTVGYLSDDEKQKILSAVYHHSDKANVHGEYDELLKDADLFQSFMKQGGLKIHAFWLSRLKKLSLELGFSMDFPAETENGTLIYKEKIIDKRSILADIAERLAAKSITGSRDDSVYMNLIRYFPEDSAFDELKNAWCGAFVYHCCQEAGFRFPIKWKPSDKLRFASVAAWNTWAHEPERNYFIQDTEGFIPEGGDIVLYRNSIPPENKPAEQRNVPIDHIGIVLGSENGRFTVAEGNVNNKNTSGILCRPLHENIEGFIRIDNDLEYDGWKCDWPLGSDR